MAYSSQSDLNEVYTSQELIRLTDDENTGNINSDRVTAAITKADNMINAYMRAQHDVPISPVPELIQNLSTSLAAYFVWKRRRKGQIDEEREITYKNDMQTLKDINTGKLIINDTESFANTGGIYYTNKSSTDKVYTSDELSKF